MTLRQKTLLTVAFIMILTLGVFFVASQQILLADYQELEEQAVRDNLDRAENALVNELDRMSTTLGDWSYWTDSYEFVVGEFPDFVEENIAPSTYESLQLSAMLYLDEAAEVYYASSYNPDTGEITPVNPSLERYVLANKALHYSSASPDPEADVHGIVMMPEGPYFLASRGVLRSDQSGPVVGSHLWARHLNADRIATLAEQTRLDLSFYRWEGDSNLPDDVAEARAGLAGERSARSALTVLDGERIAGYRLVNDLDGNPALILRVEQPRAIYQRGQDTLNSFLIFIGVIGLAVSGGLLLALNQTVLSRLSQLTAEVQRIGQQRDPSARVTVRGQDEIGQLAQGLNASFGALESAQQELQVSQARLQSVITRAPVILLAVDAQGILRLLEGQALETFGLQAERLLNQPFLEIAPNWGIQPTAYQQALAGQATHASEQIGERHMEIWYSPLPPDDRGNAA
ncbi:MAG: HAMP domain-containing protein [Anaerolineae bacterium]|nr:HAMP domain-containing protein [Anaerolineae bacterium]